jgi:hypothetical protein
MLHIIKLSVGTRDVADLRGWQAERARTHPPLRHRTRNFPRRAPEIIGMGSMYWVIGGAILVRQPIVDIIEDTRDDGTACAAIVLDHALIPVEARRIKPFQGWRYLSAEDAPADIRADRQARGVDVLPPQLLRELQTLCLL